MTSRSLLSQVADAITGNGETTRDVAHGSKTNLAENDTSCLGPEDRERKVTMENKAIKVREAFQNNSWDTKGREKNLSEEATDGQGDVTSLENSPEMQPSVALDRKRAAQSSQTPEASSITAVASDVDIRGHGGQNSKQIRTYCKADKGYDRQHDAISGRNAWVDENQGFQEIAPTEKRDSYFKTRSSALLELSPVKLKSTSPKRASYFKTRSNAMLDVSPVRLKSTRLQARMQRAGGKRVEGSVRLQVQTACSSQIQTADGTTRRHARTQRSGRQQIKGSDDVRMHAASSSRKESRKETTESATRRPAKTRRTDGKNIQAADIANRQANRGARSQTVVTASTANPYESSYQETNHTPDASVPSAASSSSSRCSSPVLYVFHDRKHQTLGLPESGQRNSTDSSYFASAELSSSVASTELSDFSLPVSVDLAKVDLSKMPVSINRAKVSLNFASNIFLNDSERKTTAASGETAPQMNEQANSHSKSAKEIIELSPEYLPIKDVTSTRHLALQEADLLSESSTATSSQEQGSDDIDLRPGMTWSNLCRAEEQSQKIIQTGSSDEATSNASMIKRSPEARAVTASKFYSRKPVSIDSQGQRVVESSKLNRAKRKLVTWTESPRSKALRLLSGSGKKRKVTAKKCGELKAEFEKLKRSGASQRFLVSTKSWNHERKKDGRQGKDSVVASSKQDEAPERGSSTADHFGQGSSSSRGQYRRYNENGRSNIQGVPRKVVTVDSNGKSCFHERRRKDVQNETTIGGNSQNPTSDEVAENCSSPLLFASTPKSSSLLARDPNSTTTAAFLSSEKPSSSFTPSENPKLVNMGLKRDQFPKTVCKFDGDFTDMSSGTQTLSSGGSLPSDTLQTSKLDWALSGKKSCRNKLLEKIDKEMKALGTVLEDIDARRILKDASMEPETRDNFNDFSQENQGSLNESFQVLDRKEQSSGTISIESSSSRTSDSGRSFKEGIFGSKDSISTKINHEGSFSTKKRMVQKTSKEVTEGDRALMKQGNTVTTSTITNVLGEKEACTDLTSDNQRKLFEIKPRRQLTMTKSTKEVIPPHEISPTSKGVTSDATDHSKISTRGKVSFRKSLPTGNYIASQVLDENNNSQLKQSNDKPVRSVNNKGTIGDYVPLFQNNTPEIENNWTIRNSSSHLGDSGKKPLQCNIEKAATTYPCFVTDNPVMEKAGSLCSIDRVNDPLEDVDSMEFDTFMSLIDESHTSQQQKIIQRTDKQKTVIEISDTDSDSLNGVEIGDCRQRFSKFAKERLSQYPECISLSSCSDISLKLSESLD